MITVTNKFTGEVTELPSGTLDELVYAYRLAGQYEEMGRRIKERVKPLLDSHLNERGATAVSKAGFIFKRYESQKTAYDREALRQVFDEDAFNSLVDVIKKRVDEQIRDGKLTEDEIKLLKSSLQPTGEVVVVTRMEKVANSID